MRLFSFAAVRFGVPAIAAASAFVAPDQAATTSPFDDQLTRGEHVDREHQHNKSAAVKRRMAGRIAVEMCKSAIPGLSVAASVDGRVVYAAGFGYADIENRTPFTPHAVCRIASISKSITSAVIGRLVQLGQLDLDADLASLLADYLGEEGRAAVKKLRGTSVRQLMAHTAGVRHYETREQIESKERRKEAADDKDADDDSDGNLDEFYSTTRYESTRDALRIFINDSLLDRDKSAFNYTTHGYTLLAAVAEAVTGLSFEYHVGALIRDLGLQHTHLDKHEPVIQHRCRYYRRNRKHQLTNAPAVDNSNKWAGGGLLSSVSDLVQFGNAMLFSFQQAPDKTDDAVKTRPLLYSSVMRSLWSPVVSMNAPPSPPDGASKVQTPPLGRAHYGLGWIVDARPDPAIVHGAPDQQYISHTGGAVGASSVLLISPDDDGGANASSAVVSSRGVVVAIICNMQGVSLLKLARSIASDAADLRDLTNLSDCGVRETLDQRR